MNTIIVKRIDEHRMVLEKTTVLIPIIEAIGMACKTAIEKGHKFCSVEMAALQRIRSILQPNLWDVL